MLPPVIHVEPHKERGFKAWRQHPKGYLCVGYGDTPEEAKQKVYEGWKYRDATTSDNSERVYTK